MKLHRAAAIAIASIVAGLCLTGCLARTNNPTLPYVQPAQSVPQVDPSAFRTAARLDEIDKEIQRLRETIERLETSGANDKVLRNLQDRVTALERQAGNKLQHVEAPSPSAPQLPDAAPKPTANNEAKSGANRLGGQIEIQNAPVNPDEKIFRDAYSAFKNGSYDQSVLLFEEMLKQHPQSMLAADAMYWIGEARLAQKMYKEAVLQFDMVLKEFPGSKKELSALLKQGEAFEKMGDDKSAKIIYQRLVSEHPHTAQARIAGSRIKGNAVN